MPAPPHRFERYVAIGDSSTEGVDDPDGCGGFRGWADRLAERIALSEGYFVERNLYPNVDFYSGIIYQAMGFPVEMFPVLFAIPRTVGWLAQWQEMLGDSEQKIARPRQIYTGPAKRDFVPIADR